MQITKEILQELFRLNTELTAARELASEQLKTVQAQFGDHEIILDRGGKKQNVSEKLLWEEVFYLGAQCEAGKALQQKYPDVFACSKTAEAKAQELNTFVLKNMAFDFKAMTITDYIKLTLALIEYAKNN